MRMLAVFHDHGCHVLDPVLRRGFRHCFAVADANGYWVRIDAMTGRPMIEVICGSDYDLATFYRAEGYTVVETRQRDRQPRWPLVVTNCVGLVKTVIGIDAPFRVTPRQLYRWLIGGAMLPGKAIFSPPKPKVTPLPEAPPPPPERADPAVTAAATKQRRAELRRRGRASTIVTGGAGVTRKAPLGRPTAGGGSQSLGG